MECRKKMQTRMKAYSGVDVPIMMLSRYVGCGVDIVIKGARPIGGRQACRERKLDSRCRALRRVLLIGGSLGETVAQHYCDVIPSFSREIGLCASHSSAGRNETVPPTKIRRGYTCQRPICNLRTRHSEPLHNLPGKALKSKLNTVTLVRGARDGARRRTRQKIRSIA